MQQPAERREDRSICWSIAADTCVKLPLENTHLVPKHHDLDAPVQLGPSARQEEAEDATQAEVGQGEGLTG
jgi:hypothetical protein